MIPRHAENDPALLDSSTPLLSLGICGGLLPAAAVAVATNIHELIEVASYLARVNCRVAVAISRRSLGIESGTGSWAFSVLGKDIVAQLPDILKQFHREQVRSRTCTRKSLLCEHYVDFYIVVDPTP